MRNETHIVIEQCKIATLQDVGRYGYEDFGVTINGAMDMYAYKVGNELVGNFDIEASIEVMVFDFSVKVLVDTFVCITGAPADVFIDNEQVELWVAHKIKADSTLYIRNIHKGLRTYIAFSGGLNVERNLGSASFDSVTKMGVSLTNGQKLKLKKANINNIEIITDKKVEIPKYGSPWEIRVTSGPDIERFAKEIDNFLSSSYKVTTETNSIGIRLNGNAIRNINAGEVLSQGVAIGAIQILPNGQPIVLHRGRTLTAGYPVIFTVSTIDLDRVGQARPGDEFNFRYISLEEAEQLYKERYK